MTLSNSQQLPENLPLDPRADISVARESFTVLNPATEEEVARVIDTQADDWLDALTRAVDAQDEYSAFNPRQRADILRAIYEEIMTRQEDFARTMTVEMGKPLVEARGETANTADYFRWFGEEAVRIPGRYAQSPAGAGDIVVSRTPVGPVLAITPWNFPLAMGARKIAPAIAAGCPVLVKPAAETPLSMLLLGQLIWDVLERFDAPRDLIHILPTTNSGELSKTLMSDARLRKITFTGSTAVGKILVRQSAQHLQRASMELGGNAPFVVAEDADLDLALSCAMQAKMRNGGEVCVAANRFLVHEAIADEFTSRLSEKMNKVVMGNGLDEGTTLGPMITATQRDRIHDLVAETVDAGATVHRGGEVPDQTGYFYPPTVLSNIPADARILREEIFGPVATISTFSTLDEAIEKANDTEFGLAAYAFSENAHTCQRFAKELAAGMVGINRGMITDIGAPFGGIKQSGFGREGGTEGIEEYLDIRYIGS